MNCAVHPDVPAVAYCRTCGKALCENCKREVMGAVYCEPCIAVRLQGSQAAAGAVPRPPGAVPPPPPGAVPMAPPIVVSSAPSPGVAMLLGFIPGVGAMYNGQFLKAFLHVVIFVLLIIATNDVSGLFGILIGFFVFYMAFDAYKTAEAKRLGLPLPDPLGLDRLFGLQEGSHATAGSAPPAAVAAAPGSMDSTTAAANTNWEAPPHAGDHIPTGAIVLIGLGVLFLLGNLAHADVFRHFWPLILIAIGLWLAYKRMALRV